MVRMRMAIKTICFAGLLTMVVASPGLILGESASVLEVGRFSTEKEDKGLPTHWETLSFRGIKQHTDYRLVEEKGQVIVRALADVSASGLIRKINIDPREYPIVQWRWKITTILKGGNVYQKDGDDYPARFYILFKYNPDKLGFFEKIKYEAIKLLYGEYPPLASITYIWASNAPEDMVVPNPYTKKAMMFVVESGKKNLNRWLTEERNVYDDYREVFKDEPPMISAVAIMTDTDNTGESATTYYGDILFLKERP